MPLVKERFSTSSCFFPNRTSPKKAKRFGSGIEIDVFHLNEWKQWSTDESFPHISLLGLILKYILMRHNQRYVYFISCTLCLQQNLVPTWCTMQLDHSPRDQGGWRTVASITLRHWLKWHHLRTLHRFFVARSWDTFCSTNAVFF